MNKRICAAFIFGLGATLALVWLLGGGQMPRLNVAHAAGPHHVAPGGDCGTASPCYATIQAAVDAADPGDTIKVAQGAYTDIHVRGGITQVVYISKTVIIHGGYTTTNWDTPDPEAHPTTLDAQGLGRVLVITGDISPTIEGLRITGGDATGLGGDPWENDSGGGVYLRQAAVIISNCTIYSNTATATGQGYGGGLYLRQSDATLTGNTVLNNTTSSANDGYGGGLYLYYSNATLSSNTVLDNIASTANRGSGGGLYLYYSNATLSSNMVLNNIASTANSGSGGGLYLNRSDATLTGNTVMSNTASTNQYGYGGGLNLYESGATLSGNTIVSNTATLNPSYIGQGGGLRVQHSSPLTLTNNLVADNHANTEGSGLWFDGESGNFTAGSLLHTTIADNAASGGSGQGVYVGDYTMLAFTNTILSGHGSVGITVTAGSAVTLEATLWHGNGSLTYGDGAIISSTNVYSAPGFVDPSTWDYHLAADSAAIDRGVDASVPDDIDGDQRPVDGDLDGTAAMDIGADEVLVPVITLTKSGPDEVEVGEPITYTLIVTNSGSLAASSLVITDALPTGASFIAASDGGLLVGGVVSWTAASLGTIDRLTRTFTVTATETITNSDYRASCSEGIGAVGAVSVVTEISSEHKIYLPLVLRGFQ